MPNSSYSCYPVIECQIRGKKAQYKGSTRSKNCFKSLLYLERVQIREIFVRFDFLGRRTLAAPMGFTVPLHLGNSSNPKPLRYFWIETFCLRKQRWNDKVGDYPKRLKNVKISRLLIQLWHLPRYLRFSESCSFPGWRNGDGNSALT